MTDQALVTGVLADALADQRDRCNAIVAAAGRAHADFDTDVVAAQLRGPLRDLMESCERAAPGSASRVLGAVFPIVTDLVAQHRLGSGGGHDALAAALPGLARQVADEPRLVVGSLANAVVHLERAGLPVDRWVARVAAAAPQADTASLLRAGQVAAWAVGLSQARASALDIARGLEGDTLAAVLGVPGPLDPAATVERLRADRWWRPDPPPAEELSAAGGSPPPVDAGASLTPPAPATAPRIATRVGGFRGFGGPFLAPPVVVALDDEVVVRAGADAWTLHADAFGATLTRTAADGPRQPAARVAADALPPGIAPVTAASVGDLTAVTIAASYHVLVVEPAR